ncbi:GNAT family N-acetyltransferase [Sabulicella rubraurantiaca]|uniref:GNAT family N-acetyltransferase n=1 Tax=Sabulicella rubraurantiaca TaxID=2811429 RepID=UPI001A95E82B|nr:GNAT family N-acetyltransferase [Sabulicella rubraurantiaca]
MTHQTAFTLRPVASEDAETCASIIFRAFGRISAAHGFPSDFATEAAALGLARAFIGSPAIFGVVAVRDGRILGSNFLSEADPVRAVGPITVEPEVQSGGVGRRLMRAVIERAGSAPIRLVQAAYNTSSFSLYASLGFEVKEPLLHLAGTPRAPVPSGITVRPMTRADIPSCDALCEATHGITRHHELGQALSQFGPMVVERGGRVTGYATAPNLWLMNHGVAETETDLMTLLIGCAAATGQPVSLLLPVRQTSLFRRVLETGMRVIQPMTLMAKGTYREPRGCWFPSVLY